MKKILSTKNGNEVKIRQIREIGKTREKGVQSEVVVWYECAKEHNS